MKSKSARPANPISAIRTASWCNSTGLRSKRSARWIPARLWIRWKSNRNCSAVYLITHARNVARSISTIFPKSCATPCSPWRTDVFLSIPVSTPFGFLEQPGRICGMARACRAAARSRCRWRAAFSLTQTARCAAKWPKPWWPWNWNTASASGRFSSFTPTKSILGIEEALPSTDSARLPWPISTKTSAK